MNIQAKRVLPDLSALDDATRSQLEGLISGLEAKVASAHKPRKLTLKISKSGGVSVYGLGRFPVSLYRGQWEKLLPMFQDIREFIDTNADLLSVKEGD